MNADANLTKELPAFPCGGTSESSAIESRHASRLANFAHDLRSPLSSILTGIEVLKLSLGDADQTGKIIGMLERQTQEMARLLQDLITPESRPAVNADPESPASMPVGSPVPKKVLVVEDSLSTANILSLFFKMEGLDVRSAYLGEDAILIAQEMAPDVIFLDLGLPDVSGYEVAARVREFAGGKQCFIVALTGRDEEEDRKHIEEAGFDFHVVKPPEPGMLREILRNLAGRSH